jgi:hypothetical protein
VKVGSYLAVYGQVGEEGWELEVRAAVVVVPGNKSWLGSGVMGPMGPMERSQASMAPMRPWIRPVSGWGWLPYKIRVQKLLTAAVLGIERIRSGSQRQARDRPQRPMRVKVAKCLCLQLLVHGAHVSTICSITAGKRPEPWAGTLW